MKDYFVCLPVPPEVLSQTWCGVDSPDFSSLYSYVFSFSLPP